ncbi:CRISPR-associated protein, Csh2 family [Haloferax gibbonsii ATCC 33959]|uniref:CRISPR-associated protein, Csh2 family n=1 Tax=Haloferax gibbonsii (strain ATCC 33959 / DSM 4427 / JCM 8863 / NBRC 102184 / NCIMB 2188 / Ma 2.38) TaxID=1227459 RepID=M0HL74_HALGM|nr:MULTISPECIES: type I-B CRISPR-associated protein Cas7/Csh2 [Haloferax]ELZ84467.1 CRISPR-associated protein, Csh2 family [Haloferax gibbonsii ATCC 33959]
MSNEIETVSNRSEIVYLYDAVDANPNGDPLTEENRPRVDDYTEEAIVTDVRLKRYVRDYLDRQGETIFVKKSGSGQRDDKGDRYQTILENAGLDEGYTDEELEAAFLDEVTDIRLFGDSMAFDDSPVDGSYTGPVQFGFGRSMHPVHETTHGKTSVLSADSEEGGAGGNMFSEHRLAYALIRFHGVIDEHAATDTRLTEADVESLEDALWQGLRSQTNTSSKRGHEPRLLLRVEYDEDAYHSGDLHRTIDLNPRVEGPKAMRDISDLDLVIDDLVATLADDADDIATVVVRASRRLQIQFDGEHGEAEILEKALGEAVGSDSVTITYE